MAIFRAIGFGIFIIMCRLLIPAVFTEAQDTAIAFLHGATVSVTAATSLAASIADTPLVYAPSNSSASVPRSFALPQAANVPLSFIP